MAKMINRLSGKLVKERLVCMTSAGFPVLPATVRRFPPTLGIQHNRPPPV